MVYRGNPSTDIGDEIRLLIGDLSTSTGAEIFADAEIDYYAGAYSNVHLAASAAVSSLVGSTRGQALAGVVSKQVGDLKIDYGQSAGATQVLTAKAKTLRLLGVRKVAPYTGGISIADKEAARSDTDWEQGVRLGQFDLTTPDST